MKVVGYVGVTRVCRLPFVELEKHDDFVYYLKAHDEQELEYSIALFDTPEQAWSAYLKLIDLLRDALPFDDERVYRWDVCALDFVEVGGNLNDSK